MGTTRACCPRPCKWPLHAPRRARAPPRSRRRGHASPPRPKAGAVAMDRAADGPRQRCRRARARARRELPGALSKAFIGTRDKCAATYIEFAGNPVCGAPTLPHLGVATWPPGRDPQVGVAGGPRRRPLVPSGRPRNIANRGKASRDQANPREAPAPPQTPLLRDGQAPGWEGRRHNERPPLGGGSPHEGPWGPPRGASTNTNAGR